MVLDPQLAHDSSWLGDLPLSQLRVIHDARFDWLMLVPARMQGAPFVSEWFELSLADQQQLHRETMAVAQALKAFSGAAKINIGALGNVVKQLHVHIIARTNDDACWPGPVWGTPMQRLSAEGITQKLERLRPILRYSAEALGKA
jgi:diadenosine tetraphosphate (Ap4A) HIT family hydrolase